MTVSKLNSFVCFIHVFYQVDINNVTVSLLRTRRGMNFYFQKILSFIVRVLDIVDHLPMWFTIETCHFMKLKNIILFFFGLQG
jgi:hypothetical protein